MWPWSKIRSLQAQLQELGSTHRSAKIDLEIARETGQSIASDLEQAQLELKTERALRISAETIAEERKGQVDRAYAALQKAEDVRDEAVKSRLTSLDLVNSTLLTKAFAPEALQKDIKEYNKGVDELPRRMSGVKASKVQDIEFVMNYINADKQRKAMQGKTPAPQTQAS